MNDQEKRAKTREALRRLATVDERASAREQIGAQVAILAVIGGIILVGLIPVAEWLRIPFLTVAFAFAFALGLTVKRELDRWYGG